MLPQKHATKPSDHACPKFNKKLKRLNSQLTDSQFIHELDKLKLPRLVKKAMYAQRKAGVSL
jgi:hypothetical protein